MLSDVVTIYYSGSDYNELISYFDQPDIKLIQLNHTENIQNLSICFFDFLNYNQDKIQEELQNLNGFLGLYTIIQVDENTLEEISTLPHLPVNEIWTGNSLPKTKASKLKFIAGNTAKNRFNLLQTQRTHQELVKGLDHIPGAIILFDTQGITYISQGWKEMIGQHFNLSLGQNFDRIAEFMIEEDAQIFKKLYLQRTQAGFFKSVYKCRFLNKNHTDAILIELTIQCNYLNKQIKNAAVFGLNISHIQKLESDLTDSENRYTALSDLSFEGIILHNNGICIDVNNSLLKLTGYSRSDLIHANLIDLFVFDPEDKKKVSNALRKNYSEPYTIKIRKLDGSSFMAEMESKMIVYKGTPIRVSAMRDITFRLESQKMLANSKAEFQSLFNHTPIGLFRCTGSGQLQMVNPVMRSMLNIPANQFTTNIFLFDTNSDTGKLRNNFVKNFSVQNPEQQYIIETKSADGSPKFYQETLHAIYNEDNKIDYIEGTSVDITDRKVAEKEEEYRRMMFHLLSISASELISLHSEERIIAYSGEMMYFMSQESLILTVQYNSETEEATLVNTTGISSNIKMVFDELVSAYRLNKPISAPNLLIDKTPLGELSKVNANTDAFLSYFLFDELKKVLNTELLLNLPHRIVLRSSSPMKYIFYIIPKNEHSISNPSFIETFVFQLETATERIRLDNQLVESRIKAERANEAKSVFLTTISHELRTPLNLIMGYNDILARQLNGTSLVNYIHSIQAAGDKLLELINDIIELSHYEPTVADSLIEPVNLFNPILEITSTYKSLAVEKNIELITQIDILRKYNFRINQNRIKQVLNHLIGNAVKFTIKGMVSIQVKFEPDANFIGELQIAISDTGIGISPENLSKIFEPFVQIDDKDDRKFGGSGLGLSIAKRMCDLMNAGISVESKMHEGTTFYITFHAIKGYENSADTQNSEGADCMQNENAVWALFLTDCFKYSELERAKYISNGSTLRQIINEQLNITWKEAVDSNSLTVMEQLADEMIETGKLLDIDVLQSFGTDLKMYAQSFNYPKLIKMLELYTKLIEQIQNLSNVE